MRTVDVFLTIMLLLSVPSQGRAADLEPTSRRVARVESATTPAAGDEPTPLPGKGVIVLLGGAPPALAQDALRQIRPDAAAAAPDTPLSSHDARLLEPLRRSLFLRSTRSGLDAPLERCPAAPGHFTEKLREAERELDFADYSAAHRRFRAAWVALGCDDEAISRAGLARFLLLQGILELLEGGRDSRFFDLALAIQPDARLPAKYVDAAGDRFRAAGARQATTVEVSIDRAVLEGFQLHVDGEALEGARARVRPGLHLLELIDAAGVAASTLVTLEASAGDTPAWPPEALRPPSDVAVIDALAAAVARCRLDDRLRGAVDGLLRQGRHPWLLVVAAPRDGGRARALWLEPGAAPECRQIDPGGLSQARRVPWAWLAGGFGVCAAAGGAWAGYTAYRVDTEEFPSLEAGAPFVKQNHVALGALGVCGAGAVVSSTLAVLGGRDPATTASAAGRGIGVAWVEDAETRYVVVRWEGRW